LLVLFRLQVHDGMVCMGSRDELLLRRGYELKDLGDGRSRGRHFDAAENRREA
jgi:hypothetical protein